MGNWEDEIVQLDVHTMFKNEALDFTPWLAKNLQMLGDAIGLELEFVQREVPVGPYFLDIKAKEADGGATVAIENQLEMTDLHHLGQLLTYATGCDARVAVWVAPYFGYEHAQALHRLNEWTKDSIRFYGVKVEVIKQAGGGPAPQFRKVVWPGGWDKKATLQQDEMDPEKLKHNEFFRPLVEKLLREDFAEKAVQRFSYNDRLFPSHLNPAIGYAVSIEKGAFEGAWAMLRIQMKEKESTKRIFDTLEANRAEIEKSVDAGHASEWYWLRYDRYAFSTIGIRRDGSIDDAPEKLAETRAWMLDLLPKLRRVFDPRLAEILNSQ